MTMNANTLGNALAAAIAGLTEVQKQSLPTIWQTIAGVVVAHIQANATVTVASGIPVATAGSATSQTGATTATGVGTIS